MDTNNFNDISGAITSISKRVTFVDRASEQSSPLPSSTKKYSHSHTPLGITTPPTTTIHSLHSHRQQQQQQPESLQLQTDSYRNINSNTTLSCTNKSIPRFPEMKFAAPIVRSNNMNLIFLATNMGHSHYHDDDNDDNEGGVASVSPPPHSQQQQQQQQQHRKMSQSMPFPSSHVHRTDSEVRLCEDEEMAEQRDLTMFYRLVNGIRDRQQMQHATTNPHAAGAAAHASEDRGSGIHSTLTGPASALVDQQGPTVLPQPFDPVDYYTNGNNNEFSSNDSQMQLQRLQQQQQAYAALSLGHCTNTAALETEKSLAHIIHTRNAKLGAEAEKGGSTTAISRDSSSGIAAMPLHFHDSQQQQQQQPQQHLERSTPGTAWPASDFQDNSNGYNPTVVGRSTQHQQFHHHQQPILSTTLDGSNHGWDNPLQQDNRIGSANINNASGDDDDEAIFDMEL